MRYIPRKIQGPANPGIVLSCPSRGPGPPVRRLVVRIGRICIIDIIRVSRVEHIGVCRFGIGSPANYLDVVSRDAAGRTHPPHHIIIRFARVSNSSVVILNPVISCLALRKDAQPYAAVVCAIYFVRAFTTTSTCLSCALAARVPERIPQIPLWAVRLDKLRVVRNVGLLTRMVRRQVRLVISW
jgi:hypothetical protein